MPRARSPLALHLLVIVLGATLPYLGGLRGELISDDVQAVAEEPRVRSLSPANLHTIFTTRDEPNYIPLKVLSFAIDYHFFGVDPTGYHVENVALHAANALLVYFLLLRLGETAGLALAVTLLWAVHPVQVESVAWISERKNVLSTFFFLLAFLAYLRFSVHPRVVTYMLLLVLFTGALLSKVNTIVLPAIMVAYEITERFRLRVRDFLTTVPLLAIGAVVAWANLHDNPSHGAAYHGGSVAVTLRTSSTVVPRYLGLVVFPWRTSSYHAVPLRASWLEPAVIAGVLLVLGIAAATVWLVAHRRRGGFWLAWFGLTLAPMLNLVPFPALMADRYLYMPLIGLLVLAARGVQLVAARWSALPRAIPWVTGAAVVACAALTVARVPVFHDELSLWADWAVRMPYITGDRPWAAARRVPETRLLQGALARHPDSAVLHNNVGGLAFDEGRLDEALGEFTLARQLDPHDPAIALNLGRAYLLTGQAAAAARTLEDAVRLEPPSYYAHLNLGRAYMQLGDTARARGAIETASRIRPQFNDWQAPLAQVQRLERSAGATPPVARKQ
jgi:hypothetical protein